LGEQSLYEDFGKIFKPITEQQQKSSEEIVSKFAPLQEAIENMPPAFPGDMPQREALAELDTPQIELDKTSLVGEYLEKYSQRKGDADTTFGIRREGKYFIGGKRVVIDKDSNLFVDRQRYEGTPGLWELIVMKKPKTGAYDGNNVKNYKEIIKRTGATRHPENPQRPVANRGHKWENFIRPIWDKPMQKPNQPKVKLQHKKTQRQGFLPSDPNALCERLELLMASKQAGNTSLRNEIVSICDKLLRQKILSHDAYKNLMLTLNKDVNN